MAWDKPSPELIARFDTWLPHDERVERRKMFGCPCAFVNGNMFSGVHEQNLIVRLPESQREQLRAEKRAQLFCVMGRTMREYVVVNDALTRKQADIASLVADAFAYATGLAAKKRKSRTIPAPRKRKAAKRPE